MAKNNRSIFRRFIVTAWFSLTALCITSTALAQVSQIHPVNMPSVVDLGATSCIPCKMMAPILEELRGEYKGRAAIIFVDVWKQKEYGQHYRIRVIPTQIFFNKHGQEVGRHEGYLDKKSIAGVLDKLLLEK